MNKISPNFFKWLTISSFTLGLSNALVNVHTRKNLQTKVDVLSAESRDIAVKLANSETTRLNELHERVIVNSVVQSNVSGVDSSMAVARTEIEKLRNPNLSLEEANAAVNSVNSSLDNASELLKAVKDLLNGSNKGGSNLISSDWLNSLSNLLYSDNLVQLTSTVNILGCIVLFFCIFSFLTVFYSNKLLEKYKVSEKYPRLEKFLALRFKFQSYYLLVDCLIIFYVLSGLIYMNVLMYQTS